MMHRPHYLDIPLFAQGDNLARRTGHASRRLWWLILALALLSLFLLSPGVGGH
jgi:hypothetical protein